jgi:hypothetical protein
MSVSDLTRSNLEETVVPFLESSDLPPPVIATVVTALLTGTSASSDSEDLKPPPAPNDSLRKLHSGVVMGEEKITEAEAESNAFMWGTDTFASKFNEQKDAAVAESAKDRRKAKQELERSRKEYEAKVRGRERNGSCIRASLQNPPLLPP